MLREVLLLIIATNVRVDLMPCKRSYHWATQLTSSQRRRQLRDEYYCSSAGQGRKFISVPEELHGDLWWMFRAKERHFQRDLANGSASNDGWRASLASSDRLSSKEIQEDLKLYSRGNTGKHSHSNFPDSSAAFLDEASSPPSCGTVGISTWPPLPASTSLSVGHKSFSPASVVTSGGESFSSPLSGKGHSQRKAWADITDGGVDKSFSWDCKDDGTNFLCEDHFVFSAKRAHVDLEEQMPTDSDRNASAKVELLSNAQVKADADGRFGAELSDQVVMLRAENDKIYQGIAELRNENLRLFDNSASLQQELCGLRAQLQAAESAMGVWASHATALEEQLFEQRRQCFLGMCHGGDNAHLSWHGVGGEPQFLGVYGHLHSGSGSKCRIELNPCSSPGDQLQSGTGSELRIDDEDGFVVSTGVHGQELGIHSSNEDDLLLRIQVIERQLEKTAAVQSDSIGRWDSFDGRLRKLASSLGTVVQESVERRFDSAGAKFVLVDCLDQQLKTSHEQLEAALSSLLADQLKVTMKQVDELMRNGFGSNKSVDAKLASFFTESADRDVLVQKQCEEFKLSVSQLAQSLACSRDDVDRSLAQLWEAFDILKSEVKELVRSHAEASLDDERLQPILASPVLRSAAGDAVLSSGQLVPPKRIPNGSVVVTHSLRNMALNGVMGIVFAYHADRQRYAVRIMGTDSSCPEEKLFKGDNLVIDENMPVFDPKECAWDDCEYSLSRSSSLFCDLLD